jgi:putative methionine-R-sulfoxide reductase with GAF domain
MKFLRHLSLKHLGLFLLAILVLVYTAEYFIVRYQIDAAAESGYKKDFTRSAQLETQQISLQVQRFLAGRTELQGEITSRMDLQTKHLSILKDGGRIEGTENFLKPLSRLSRITFDNLQEAWTHYRKSVNILITEQPMIDTTMVVMPTVSSTDSTQTPTNATTTTIQFENRRYKVAQSTFEGQWLTVSTWHNRLLEDLEEEAQASQARLKTVYATVAIFNILLLGAGLLLFFRHVLNPIGQLTQNVVNRTPDSKFAHGELGELSRQTNALLDQLHTATEFVTTIGEGKLDATYADEANGTSNRLADSLVGMQSKLKALNEEEKKRQWANEGLTQFVDILRSSDDNIAALGDKIIAALVKYTHSNQGALYILNDDDEQKKYLELVSLFAFNTKKFEAQHVKLGEGILGQTFLEKETTLLTEIPEDFVRITSGLGEAGPKAILMVPLKVDQNVYGIVELASFNDYEQHEIAFVEKLGETIASTLGSVKAAQRNRHLIEQFQQQTEQMRSQEEEMRQNMEELTATQEEMSRKERDYIDRIKVLEDQGNTQELDQELQKTRHELSVLQQQFRARVDELERQLDAKPERSDDWQRAEEVENMLKISLEALKITQAEMNLKTGIK